MYQFEIQDDIENRVSSQTVRHLHRLWLRFSAASGGGLPAFADLGPQRLEWCAPSLMVLEPIGEEDFLYRYYGSAIAHAARFDMTGKRTSNFRSDVGRFFREKYLRCLRSERPLYTVHRATHVPTVHTWERLLLPVREDDGMLIVALNQPMAFRHEFLQGVIESTSNGIIFGGALHGEGTAVADFQVLSANSAAARLLGRTPGSLEERPLSSILPEQLNRHIMGLCREVFRSGDADSIQVTDMYNGVERVIQASGVRSGDGVTLVLAEATRLRAQEIALRDLEQELDRERQARTRLETQLRWSTDADFIAGSPRRPALLASLALQVDAAVRDGRPVSLVVIGLDGPGGPQAENSFAASDEVLSAVTRLCQGMLRRGDDLARIAASRYCAVLPETTVEEAIEIAGRIVESVALRFRSQPMLSGRITASAGVARLESGEDAAALLDRTEALLHEARLAGRGSVRAAQP